MNYYYNIFQRFRNDEFRSRSKISIEIEWSIDSSEQQPNRPAWAPNWNVTYIKKQRPSSHTSQSVCISSIPTDFDVIEILYGKERFVVQPQYTWTFRSEMTNIHYFRNKKKFSLFFKSDICFLLKIMFIL